MESKNKGHPTRRIDFTSTPISDIFRGQLKSSIHRNGDYITENIQPFLTLPFNIEKVKTAREALKVLKNSLEGLTSSKTNEKVKAHDHCTKVIKRLWILNSSLVSSKTQSPTEKQYKLFAVVYQEGKNTNIGHYVTDAFQVGYNCWIRYNDSSVKTVQEACSLFAVL
ncbi:ubiquitin carboxyl-terminal hydrolase 10-B-like [Leptinotarsa decemlineata]|uniref:ubiquitin carboxyl-terminal hydrolase 10-B-like n=1 Tax=Leptinotarsa decemlineata TaxID=7539 RepID=UPI003D308F7F